MIYTRSYISKLGAFTLTCQFSQHDLTRSYISKLGAFTLVCRFSLQHNLHKIIHLQTRGILPNLSTKQSFLNMLHTRSHAFETRGIRPLFLIGKIFKSKGTSPTLPQKALIYKSIIGHSSFCFCERTLNHFISLIAFRGFGLIILK